MDARESSRKVIGAAVRAHAHFGPGYSEEVYKNALMAELGNESLRSEKAAGLPVYCHGVRVGDYKADVIAEKCLMLELKAAETITGRHEAQPADYLVATGIGCGLIPNFGAPSLQFRRKFRIHTPSFTASSPRAPSKNHADYVDSVPGPSASSWPHSQKSANPVNPVKRILQRLPAQHSRTPSRILRIPSLGEPDK